MLMTSIYKSIIFNNIAISKKFSTILVLLLVQKFIYNQLYIFVQIFEQPSMLYIFQLSHLDDI